MNYDYDVECACALCIVCFMRKLLVVCSLICSVAFSAQNGVAQNDGFMDCVMRCEMVDTVLLL